MKGNWVIKIPLALMILFAAGALVWRGAVGGEMLLLGELNTLQRVWFIICAVPTAIIGLAVLGA